MSDHRRESSNGTAYPNSGGLTATGIKMIAVVTMLIDHVAAAIILFLPGATVADSGMNLLYSLMRLVGRLAFPLFIYMLTEGLLHTRSRWRYLIRLIIFAIISEYPFDMALYGKFPVWDHQNVFFTLSIGLLMLMAFEYVKETDILRFIPDMVLKAGAFFLGGAGFTVLGRLYLSGHLAYRVPVWMQYLLSFIILESLIFGMIVFAGKKVGARGTRILCADIVILAAASLTGQFLEVDYHYSGILAIAFMYFFRNDIVKSFGAGSAVLTVFSSTAELMACADIPVMYLYNGKRGRGYKYFFYFFYPAHFAILALISHRLGLK